MTYKLIPFISITLGVIGMFLLIYASITLWITIFAIVHGVIGLIYLNVTHYKILKRLMKHDKNYFDETL